MDLEIYKIHAAASDDVSRRRDSANRMYLGVTTSIVITMGIVGGWDDGGWRTWGSLTGLSALGWVVQAGWLGVIQSYRQLNRAKFAVLLELEKNLTFDFYTREWKEAGEGKDPAKYREATIAEKDLPRYLQWAFGVVGIAAAGAGVWTLAEAWGLFAG